MIGGIAPASAVLVIATTAAARGTWSPCGLSMISAINPFSETSRGHRYWLTALWFVAGTITGGAALGMLGLLGAMAVGLLHLPVTVAMAAAGVCCLVAAGADAPFMPYSLPLIPRQVNERWLAGYRRWFYASGFGAQIGFGLVTYVMTAAVYLVPTLGAVSGSPALAFLAGVMFGLVRGLAILLTASAGTPDRLRRLHARLAVLEPRSRQVVLTVECAVAVGCCAAVAGPAAALALAGAAAIGWGVVHGRRYSPREPTAR